MRLIVTSRDEIELAVETTQISARFEQAYAETRTADELESGGDFVRVNARVQENPDAELAVDVATRPSEYAPPVCAAGAHEVEALDRAAKLWGCAGYVTGDKL